MQIDEISNSILTTEEWSLTRTEDEGIFNEK